MSLEKFSSKKLLLLMAWFILVVNFLSHYAYFFFNVTAFIVLCFLTHGYYYNQKRICSATSRLVTLAFGLLALSQLFFIFEWLNLQLYVVGTIIQTIAFVLLLYAYLTVSKR